MIDAVAVHALQYLNYAVELVLVTLVLMRGRWRSLGAFSAYVCSYFVVDAILRPAVLRTFGYSSLQYRYTYWVSDVGLALGAFLLICFFFRRACSDNPDRWSSLRTMLAATFVIIALISYFTIAHYYDHLFSRFIIDLQQNLFFACLVLNTLLYVMLQQWESKDEQLSLLVCGLGIQFAGLAGGMALMYLTPGGKGAGVLFNLLSPVCNLGMFLVWMYAVALKTTEEISTAAAPQMQRTEVHYRSELASAKAAMRER